MIPRPVVLSSPLPTLGRKRTRDFDLPPRLHRRGTAYWHVSSGKPRRWISLGTDRADALRKWAQLETGQAPSLTVGEFLDSFVAGHRCSANTRRQYRSYANALGRDLPIPASELRGTHIALWRDGNKHRPAFVNGCLALLNVAWMVAREHGHTDADIRVNKLPAIERDRRVTMREFERIRAHAPGWLALALDLGYLIAARPVDIRNLRWDQVTDRLDVRQIKTNVRQAFTVTPELAAVLARARQRRVLGLYVVADERGRQISKDRLEKAMRAACEAAGVSDTTFRDVRAMAATDAEEAGQDAQALLGHASPKMTERYLRARRTLKAEPVRRKL